MHICVADSLSPSAPVHVRQKQAVIRCHGSCDGDCADMSVEVRCHGWALELSVCCALVPSQRRTLAVTMAPTASAFVHTHTHLRVAEAQSSWSCLGCGDIFIERAQLPACCTNFCSSRGRIEGIGGGCDHVILRTLSCCRPFVTIYCAGVSADTCASQTSCGVIPYDSAHTCVLQVKTGVRGRSFRLRGLRMFLSSSAPVHVWQQQATICCHWCGASVFVHRHSCVWQNSKEFVVMPRLAVTF